MRFAENAIGAKPLGLEAGGASLDAVFFGKPVGGNDDAIAASAAANPDGPAFQLGIERDFATGEERISVNVQYAVEARGHKATMIMGGRAYWRWRLTTTWRPMPARRMSTPVSAGHDGSKRQE